MSEIGKRVTDEDGQGGRIVQHLATHARVRWDGSFRVSNVPWSRFVDGEGDGSPARPYRVQA